MSFVKAKNKCVNFVQCFEENKTIGAKQLIELWKEMGGFLGLFVWPFY